MDNASLRRRIMENEAPPIWKALGLGTPHPVVGARRVTSESLQNPYDSTWMPKAGKPKELCGVLYSPTRDSYYIRIYHNGKRYQRSSFKSIQEAVAARDALEREIGKVL